MLSAWSVALEELARTQTVKLNWSSEMTNETNSPSTVLPWDAEPHLWISYDNISFLEMSMREKYRHAKDMISTVSGQLSSRNYWQVIRDMVEVLTYVWVGIGLVPLLGTLVVQKEDIGVGDNGLFPLPILSKCKVILWWIVWNKYIILRNSSEAVDFRVWSDIVHIKLLITHFSYRKHLHTFIYIQLRFKMMIVEIFI